jgi:hypothetical protein
MFWKKKYQPSKDFVVALSTSKEKLKKDCPVVIVPIQQIWTQDSFWNKAKSIIKMNYIPDKNLVRMLADKIFIEDYFGKKEDLSIPLFDLMVWHQNRQWELNHLIDSDNIKADALEAMSALSRRRYREYTSPNLDLKLAPKHPAIGYYIFSLVAKTPIRSIRYFVDVHSRYTFNSIRKSNHKYANDIISYLYEILIIHQKTANSLHSLVKLIHSSQNNKKDALLLKNEIDASMTIDTVISYLKASIEKNVSLIGYTFNISKLESKKEHKKRLSALRQGIPDIVKKQPYYQYVEEYISSKRLEELNKLRTGILHKKGIASIQPHSFYQNENAYKELSKLFHFLLDQHSINSTILIKSLCLLTDELVKLDKPEFKLNEIPFESLNK